MKNMKILHVASFQGNIGDNANHTGFRSKFNEALGITPQYDEFEIRNVFWGKKHFDEDFVSLANSYDLVIVGGGNYFELWVENSATGTSFDMELGLLRKIKTPIVFNALGVDPAQGAKEASVQKFRDFLNEAKKGGRCVFSCRNDGSMEALKDIVGLNYADMFHHIPDAGFFTSVKDYYHPELSPDKKNIVLQIAGDMLETRFPVESGEDLSYSEFLKGMAQYMIKLSNDVDVNFILVPHIFRDLQVIYDLLDELPDYIRRGSLSVAPYLVGQKGQDYIFDIYRKSDLVLGMRFHASVCGLGLGVPTIGLVNYRQIDKLYEEMKLNDFKVFVNKKGFDKLLENISIPLLNNRSLYRDNYLDLWEKKLESFHYYLKNWLSKI